MDPTRVCVPTHWSEANMELEREFLEESVPSAATRRAGIDQTLFPASVFCFQAPSKSPFTGLKIRWDVCHLTTLTVILPLGLVENKKKNGELCLFPLEARCLLRPSLSYIKRCLSHVVRGRGQASHRNMASIGIRSGHSQPLSIIGSCIQNKERNKTKPDLFLRRVWNQAFPFQAVIG